MAGKESFGNKRCGGSTHEWNLEFRFVLGKNATRQKIMQCNITQTLGTLA